ncbi:hypothetical protein G3I40_19385 [Streptomyces sp. SID14478]|nr:hypothetical protein [Streptomyces sp. SID14478]NEB77367.1 hypothetical protein [Streptomyces sp. SID14478]
MPITNAYAEGKLWDPSGHPWTRVKNWIDPDEAEDLVTSAAAWVINGCS